MLNYQSVIQPSHNRIAIIFYVFYMESYTRSRLKANKKHAKLLTYTNKGMQIVTRAERKLRYKQNMLLRHNQFQSSKCTTIHVRVIKLFSVRIKTVT